MIFLVFHLHKHRHSLLTLIKHFVYSKLSSAYLEYLLQAVKLQLCHTFDFQYNTCINVRGFSFSYVQKCIKVPIFLFQI